MQAELDADGGDVPGDYLPVFDATSQTLIPIADAWFVPRLGRCYRKSALLA